MRRRMPTGMACGRWPRSKPLPVDYRRETLSAFADIPLLISNSAQRPALSRYEIREGVLGPCPPHHTGGVFPLLRPLLFEALPHLLQQQGLDAFDGGAVVVGNHPRQFHRLRP